MKEYRRRVEAEHPEKAEARREYMRNYVRMRRADPQWAETREQRNTAHALNFLAKRGYTITKDGKPVASHEGGITE